MAKGIVLRRAGPADAAAIHRVTREAYARWAALIGREPAPMGADYDAAVRAHRFDLHHVDGELVALIETVDEGDQLLIENVAVLPAFQGRGLGAALMAHAEVIARALGYVRLRLYTNQRFAENLRLYLRLGYRVDGEEDLGPGRLRVHMSKPLGAGDRDGVSSSGVVVDSACNGAQTIPVKRTGETP